MQQVKELHQKWQHLIPPSFFIGGFLFDVVTIGRIDDLSNILIFSFYLLLSLALFFYELLSLHADQNNLTIKIPSLFLRPIFKSKSIKNIIDEYKDEAFHFAQGALLSGFTLFYFKSADFSSSLLFLFILLIPLVINEFNQIRKMGIIIKSVFLNLTLMSFVLVYTPLPFGRVGLFVFITGLVLYLLICFGILNLFIRKKVSFKILKKYWITPALSLTLIFLVLRLFKLIPPVPLSLEAAGVYHNIEKEYPLYKLYHEKKWWRFWDSSDEYFLARPGDRLYFFGSIFSPRGFKDEIYVRWKKLENGKWATSDRIPLSITGGRDRGYRGITYKENYTPGHWRVSVETSGGVEIGRKSFEIITDHSTSDRQFQITISD